MKALTGGFALLALLGLVAISFWATGHQSIMIPIRSLIADPAAGNNPWLLATLFDAYFAFLWFWLWVAYKESAWPARLVWLVAILLLGNMAMAAYVLWQLWKLPADARVEDLLLRSPRV